MKRDFQMIKLVAECESSGKPYLEFLHSEALSVGIYVLPAGGVDRQQPHTEDEVYHVISGRAILQVEDEQYPVEPGSVVFVQAGLNHRFTEITEELTVLVFFAPAEYSRAT